MKKARVCFRTIVFLNVLLFQVVSAGVLAESNGQKPQMATILKNRELGNKGSSQSAKQLWDTFFFANARFR